MTVAIRISKYLVYSFEKRIFLPKYFWRQPANYVCLLVRSPKQINPRPCRGGGDATPHEFFWNSFRTAWWIVLKFCIVYGASFAQLSFFFDRVRLGHGAMTSQEVQPPTDFSSKSCHVACCH